MNDKKDSTGYSIQDVSKKLAMPENTIRKYLTYFELAVDKVGRKTVLSDETIKCLTEIVQLKANGWSLKQIQTFRNSQNNNSERTDENINIDNESIPENNEKKEEETNHSDGLITESNEAENKTKSNLTSEAIDSQEAEKEVSTIPDNYEINASSKQNTENVTERNLPQIDEEKPKTESFIDIDIDEDGSDLEAELLGELSQQAKKEESKQEPGIETPENSNQENSVIAPSQNKFSSQNNQGTKRDKQSITIIRPRLTKDYINREIATQAKRASRLYRFLGSRNSAKDSAEIKSDLDRRVEFLNGLRYIRDNWLDSQSSHQENNYQQQEKDFAGAN